MWILHTAKYSAFIAARSPVQKTNANTSKCMSIKYSSWEKFEKFGVNSSGRRRTWMKTSRFRFGSLLLCQLWDRVKGESAYWAYGFMEVANSPQIIRASSSIFEQPEPIPYRGRFYTKIIYSDTPNRRELIEFQLFMLPLA